MKTFRVVLLPLSLLYWLATGIRNWLFEIGILRVTTLDVPVISVGNISAGGTGKTPLVEVIVRKLKSKGRKPAIVSRGYGRKSKGYVVVSKSGKHIAQAGEAGDEPSALARRLEDVTIVVDEDRVEGARRTIEESGSDCIVLDDGFQHRYLARDLNIVLLTADEIVRSDYLLPAGNRRESLSSLKRADIIVVSKLKCSSEYSEVIDKLGNWKNKKMAGFRFKPMALRSATDGRCYNRSQAETIRVVIFSGIGDPDSFERSVTEFGYAVVGRIDFPDHHWYTGEDLVSLRREFRNHDAKLLVTTQKDLVRTQALGKKSEEFFKDVPVYVLGVTPEFVAGEDVLDELIEGVLR